MSDAQTPQTYSMNEWIRVLRAARRDPSGYTTVDSYAYPSPPRQMSRSQLTIHRAITRDTRGFWIAWCRMGPLLLSRHEPGEMIPRPTYSPTPGLRPGWNFQGERFTRAMWRVDPETPIIDHHPRTEVSSEINEWMRAHRLWEVSTPTRGELATILRAALAR